MKACVVQELSGPEGLVYTDVQDVAGNDDVLVIGVRAAGVCFPDLLLSKGDVPKEAWINPHGGHLGRQVGVWPDPRIFKEVIIPWLVKTLQ